MTWEIAAFAVLFAALACGFAWYERTHPGSRMLALVATLAALAALGRIAFAPLPNVKPTTDIVLIAGLALGAAPGFVVGAVAALASNLVFGQGPWTPWQMVAWGLCGVLGALLGRVAGREPGRIPLAVACGAAGLAFGAIMDASVWVTYGGQHTLGQYLAISATSLPFNLAHAAGNVAFALAFGPVLVRALLRYRARLEVTWDPPAPLAAPVGPAVLAVLAASAALAGGMLSPGTASAAGAPNAARWLAAAQNADGGWGASHGAASNAVQTSWTVVGLAAAGYDPLRVRRRGRTPLALLRRYAARSRSAADLQRTAIALGAAGLSLRTGGLYGRLRASQGSGGDFGGLVNLTAYGLIALRTAGLSARSRPVRRAAAWLARRQNADGGFNFAGRGPSGVDDTAAAIQALVTAGRGRAAGRAITWLVRHQNPDGGFALQPPARSNAQSTAFAVQALAAAGRSPDRLRRGGGRTPLAYLRSLQSANGVVRYSRTSAQTPVWVTAQALAAFARRPLPFVLKR